MKYEDWLPVAEELALGEQTQIHHCRTGRDNDRLYIKKDIEGNMMAYCHHCGAKARKSNTNKYNRVNRLHSNLNVKGPIYLPRDFTYDMPVHAKVVTNKAGLSREVLKQYEIGYSPYHDRIIIPVFNPTLVGYQAKRLSGDGPKYVTITNDPDKMVWHKKNNSTLCLTEDVFSAIRVGEVCSSACLMGTTLRTGLYPVVSEYKDFRVWLDNDNRQVKMRQVQLKQILDQFGTTEIIKTAEDPKLLTSNIIYNNIYNTNI